MTLSASSSRACCVTTSRGSIARQQLDRRRHDVAHHPRALAAAEDEEPELAAVQRRRDRASRAAASTAGRTGLPVWTTARRRPPGCRLTSGKPVAMAATRAGKEAVGAPHDARSARGSRSGCAASTPRSPAARSDSRRSRRPPPAVIRRSRRLRLQEAAAEEERRLRHLQRRAARRRRRGDLDHLLGREAPGERAGAAIRRERDARHRAAAAPWRAPRPERGGRRCRRPRAGRAARPVMRRDPSRSAISARGRRRVSAIRKPMPSASEISEEPP